MLWSEGVNPDHFLHRVHMCVIHLCVYFCAQFLLSNFAPTFHFFFINSALKIQLLFNIISANIVPFSHCFNKKDSFEPPSMPLFWHYSLSYPSRSFLLLLLSEQKKMILAIIYKIKCAHSDWDRNRDKDNVEMK